MTVADEGDISIGRDEVQWGEILDACLTEHLLPRDVELFTDLLRGFRTSVQAGQEFEERMGAVRMATNLQTRHTHLRNAVLAVFLEKGVAPKLRESTGRAAILRLLSAAKEGSGTLGRTIGPFVYELGKLLMDSNTLRLVDVERRRRFAEGNLWKVYRLPGVD
jgi:hypothetical protein